MHTLYALQAELSHFRTNLQELITFRDDAIYALFSRPSGDIPYVSQGKNQSSNVERVVIMLVDDRGVQYLQEMVSACEILYKESPHAWQVMLTQFWKGKHSADLPEELLRRYETLRYVEISLQQGSY